MKKILIIITIFFSTISTINAKDIKRIVVGNKDAKITIITFESLTCSHCANFHKDVYPKLKKDYLDTGLAKIEFRHFPLDIAAFNASKISQCRNDGDSEIIQYLFENQNNWMGGSTTIDKVNSNLLKYTKENMKFFNINMENCLKDKNIEDFVLNDRIDGVKKYKINATPTIIINDKKFEKSLNYKNLKKALEKLI